MIIDFIGCPRSGKTTTAARVFANLKEAGFNCEYVTEQARLYIAEKRVSQNLKPTDTLVLTDIDQRQIMSRQLEHLDLMVKSCGDDALIVTDTSPLNSLLYMTEEYRSKVEPLTDWYKTYPRLTFYARPVEWVGGLDPNRVHSQEQSLAINDSIPKIIFPLLKEEPVILIGDADMRWRFATSEVLRRIMNNDSTS